MLSSLLEIICSLGYSSALDVPDAFCNLSVPVKRASSNTLNFSVVKELALPIPFINDHKLLSSSYNVGYEPSTTCTPSMISQDEFPLIILNSIHSKYFDSSPLKSDGNVSVIECLCNFPFSVIEANV